MFLQSRGLIEALLNFNTTEYKTTKKGEQTLLKYYQLISDFFNLE